jgi:hypothetical protein
MTSWADFLFTRFGDVVVDVVGVRLELGDLLVGNVESELFLSLRERYPQPAPGPEFFVRRKKILHLAARVPRAERAFVTVS